MNVSRDVRLSVYAEDRDDSSQLQVVIKNNEDFVTVNAGVPWGDHVSLKIDRDELEELARRILEALGE